MGEVFIILLLLLSGSWVKGTFTLWSSPLVMGPAPLFALAHFTPLLEYEARAGTLGVDVKTYDLLSLVYTLHQIFHNLLFRFTHLIPKILINNINEDRNINLAIYDFFFTGH